MPKTEERKSPVSVLKYAYAPLISDTAEGVEYGAVVDMGDTLISAGYTPAMNITPQYASGKQYDSYVSKSGGTHDVQTPGLNPDDYKNLLGYACSETGEITSNKADVVPDVASMYATETSDGKVNLYKFFKVKFTFSGETVTTKDANGVTFQATNLNGQYAPLIYNGDDMKMMKGLDPVSDKETIDKWFKEVVPAAE